MPVWGRLTPRMFRRSEVVWWTVGTCAEDLEGFDPEDADRHHTPSMMKAIETNCHPLKAQYFFNLPLVPKRGLVEYLGPELAAMCWYCRQPVFEEEDMAAPCGKCPICEIVKTTALYGS